LHRLGRRPRVNGRDRRAPAARTAALGRLRPRTRDRLRQRPDATADCRYRLRTRCDRGGDGCPERWAARTLAPLRPALLSGERRGSRLRGTRLSADARQIIAAQAARALAYGLGSVLIGLTLANRGLSNAAVGVVLAALLAGIALVSVLIARHGDSFGRR